MSIQSWRLEFYPIAASACPERIALQHSLNKWTGLLPENLAKHGVVTVREGGMGNFVVEPIGSDSYFDSIPINASSCALCEHFYSVDGDDDYAPPCSTCPLYKARGGKACDCERADEDIAPWPAWQCDKNPVPMVAALQAALEKAEARSKCLHWGVGGWYQKGWVGRHTAPVENPLS
jgi:hypothetical protein